MRSFLPLIATAALASGCATLGLVDNGTHLAFALERGAAELRASGRQELVVRYVPLEGEAEPYEVTLKHSRKEVVVDRFGNTAGPGGAYIVVTGRHRGGTSDHERFVFTPHDLHVAKQRGATEVVLRKAGNRIDVVELR